MKSKKAQLIVALDVDTLGDVRILIDTLSPVVDSFKVGSQLFTSCGPAAVRFSLARGKNVFLDLKYHDIPNTVASAIRAAVGLNNPVHTPLDEESGEQTESKTGNVFMCTLHTQGGSEMMRAAVQAAQQRAEELKVMKPLLVGVTVLTSEENKDSIQALVLKRALLAAEAGLDGVVCSAQEAPLVRRELGNNFIIVTPGVRPAGDGVDDQKRVVTPREAVERGSNYLVVGRPIVKAQNPRESAKNILREIN